MRLIFLAQAEESGQDKIAGYPRSLWDDADTRWLIDVHRARVEPAAEGNQSIGEQYFNKELHERLVWWLRLPQADRFGPRA